MISTADAPSRSRPAATARSSKSWVSSVVMSTPAWTARAMSLRRRAGTSGTPTRRAVLPRGGGLPRRSRGSAERRHGWSSCQRLVGRACRPLGEPFAVLALGKEVPYQALDVFREVSCGDLVSTEFASEPGIEAEATAEVNLKPLLTLDDLSLESDVGDLDTRARAGAAVDVESDRGVDLVLDIGEARV